MRQDVALSSHFVACHALPARHKLRAMSTPDGATMKRIQFSLSAAVCFMWVMVAVPYAAAQELPNLPAITPADLALKDNPAAPGSAAMILYCAVETDNTKSTETESIRIKVFQDEGRKYANVEIPYYDKATQVEDIRARTVGQDGKISEFTDQIYDREIMKAKKLRVNAKVLTLPNVQAGTIIEYSYRLHFKEKFPDALRHPEGYLFKYADAYPAAQWEIQRSLFVRHGRFLLHGLKGARIEDFYVSLPSDVSPRKSADGTVQIDLDNIPAYQEEEFSPPEENLKIRANLFYTVGFYSEDAYWAGVAARKGEVAEKFIGKSKAIQTEAARLVSPDDPEETKLRKIYERVQQIRAVSFEEAKTEKEKKQESLKENNSAEDVLIRGYAYANQINLLFVALARAAGLDAIPMMVSSRKQAFFMKGYPNEQQLNAMVVLVRTRSGFVYLDPATKFCPYELLPWEESDAGGVLADSQRPKVWATPLSKSKDAIVRREADLKMNSDGGLSGKVAVRFFGQEALNVRLGAMRKDEAERRKELEESLKSTLVQGATVKLLKVEGLDDLQMPLRAEFEVDVPNFAVPAGKRLLLPVGVFHAHEKNPFSSPNRTYPIYFGYPHESYEEVRIELPTGIDVESLPADTKADQGAFYYESSAKKDGNLLQLLRTFRVSGYFFVQGQHKNVSQFYSRVLEGDSQQAALRGIEAAGQK
jgi:hypothetical protein